jgi:hypothetical protein
MSKIMRFYYCLLSILSEKLATFTITIAIGKNYDTVAVLA